MSSGPWRRDHDPFARPLGCNGRYGASGRVGHTRRGEPICDACRESSGHYLRELRGGGLNPRKLQPCGTIAAARRHRRKGEVLDFACRVAEATYRAELRERKKAA